MILFDFSRNEHLNTWNTLNDDVMGGLSTSRITNTENGTVLFEGNISLQNNGGFASIRSPILSYDFSDSNGIQLKIKGDGKRYGLSLRETEYFTGYNFTNKFSTKKNNWEVINLFFDEFKLKYYGKITGWQPSVIKDQIKQISIIISEKQKGPFRLEIASIRLL